MAIPRARRKWIAELADVVRENCGGDVFPVNVERVIEELGGALQEQTEIDHEAEIERTGLDEFEIRINAAEIRSGTRRRFTLAHEVGHLMVHMRYDLEESQQEHVWREQEVYRRSGNSTNEHEANEFAACLLMPASVFADQVERNSVGNLVRIDPIAEFFGVSVAAAKTRGQWLGLLEWH